eukprot:11165344-Lingulodinium_polyedra.AAC.1
MGWSFADVHQRHATATHSGPGGVRGAPGARGPGTREARGCRYVGRAFPEGSWVQTPVHRAPRLGAPRVHSRLPRVRCTG